MAPLGISGIQELAGNTHWFVYIILTGINVSMNMVILYRDLVTQETAFSVRNKKTYFRSFRHENSYSEDSENK